MNVDDGMMTWHKRYIFLCLVTNHSILIYNSKKQHYVVSIQSFDDEHQTLELFFPIHGFSSAFFSMFALQRLLGRGMEGHNHNLKAQSNVSVNKNSGIAVSISSARQSFSEFASAGEIMASNGRVTEKKSSKS